MERGAAQHINSEGKEAWPSVLGERERERQELEQDLKLPHPLQGLKVLASKQLETCVFAPVQRPGPAFLDGQPENLTT